MGNPKLSYRVWQHGITWHWEVMSEDRKEVLLSGVADSSLAARCAAFKYCLGHPSNHAASN
jgi:hypothetical protein